MAIAFPSDSEVAKLGDDRAIELHYEAQANLATLVELIDDLEHALGAWSTTSPGERAELLDERAAIVADVERLVTSAASSPLLASHVAVVREQWAAVEPKLLALR